MTLTFVGLAGCKYVRAGPTVSDPPITTTLPSKPVGGGSQTPLQSFLPEDFGAVGDGVTNDTEAFARMTDAVNAVGGGTIILAPKTYVVGAQVTNAQSRYAFDPAPIMEFDGCKRALTIQGNGARLLCADGLRFGTFARSTGLPTQNPMPNYDVSEVASPYLAMITVQNCTGKVSIENLELDGNVDRLLLGGPFGDTGWQIPGTGIRLINNSGGETLKNIHTHHHALDGLLISTLLDRATSTVCETVVSEYNARQGCSIVSGSNFKFANCRFNHTGKAKFYSAPGAGVDIEAETSPIRNLGFVGCEFSNNSGVGMIADSGDTEAATFRQCRFIGTASWAAWPAKPNFRFEDCEFVGSICQAHGDPDPSRAVQFLRCSFTDDPALTPTKQVYAPRLPIADLGSGDVNVRFDGCDFELQNASVLPWTLQSTFNNCTMVQTSSQQAYPRGFFTGTNRIEGNVDLYGSKISGSLTVNGTIVPPT
jgi:hypothetical protein